MGTGKGKGDGEGGGNRKRKAHMWRRCTSTSMVNRPRERGGGGLERAKHTECRTLLIM
jgi:hypothetical protein